MNKQPASKNDANRRAAAGTSRAGATGATGAAATRSSASGVAPKGTARPQGGTAAKRPAGTVAHKKSGFRLRPLDIALLLIGLVVVGAIVYGGLSGANKDVSALAPPSSSQPQIEYLPVGSQAPDFSHPATDGQTYSLSQFKNKVVVLQFMAPWCPHCQNDAPMFNKLYEQYKGKEVQFLDLSATDLNKDRSGPIAMEDLIWFRDTFKVPFPMLLDKELKTADAYKIDYFPTVYVVDKKGNIAVGLNNDPDNPNGLEQRLTAEVDKQLQQ